MGIQRSAAALAMMVAFGLAIAESASTDTVVAVNRSAVLPGTATYDIPAGDLASALKALARQADIQLIYTPDITATDTVTLPLKGKYTAEQALQHILANTDLTYITNDKDTIVIRKRDLKLSQAEAPVVSNAAGADVRSADDDRKEITEIIVTAQKRDQKLIDVPISMVVLSSDELKKRKVTNIDDLSLAAPGLAIRSNGSFSRQIAIRGINNSANNTTNLIGMYVDEAPATSPVTTSNQLDLRTYDLERVEVLRGPQGTLYGEGSVGGTIRFITRNPQLNDFAMNSSVAALFTQDGAPSQRIEGAVNVPLIENELGLRIAGTFDHQGGWIDQPAANKKDYNEQNLADVRVKGLWRPTERLTANAMALIHRNNAAPNNAEDDNGNYTQVFNLLTTPDAKDHYALYNLTLSYDFGAARLLSASSYIDQDKEFMHLGAPRQLQAPPAVPTNALNDLVLSSGKAFTEELRLTSVGAGPWQWTVGAFYRDTRTRQDTPTFYSGSLGVPGTPLPTAISISSRDRSTSRAVFGDASYQLTERITVGSGLRYFEDDRETASGFAFGAPAVLGPTQTGRFHTLNPRVYGQYKITEQAAAYASVAKGFRSGGFNASNQPRFDPESAWTYELGTKMSLAGGRLSSDAAIYYTDYRDYQVFGLTPAGTGVPLSIVTNAGNVRIKGVEWALSWHPTAHWSLGFNSTYVDSTFVEINTFPHPVTGAPTSSYIVGDPLDGIPKYQFTLSGQRDFDWNGKLGFVRLDYNQQDRMTYRSRSIGPWYISQSDLINMLNFNMNLQWNESLSLNLFSQNLLNDRGYVGSNTIEGSAARARPRTFGVGFEVAFD